MVRRIAVLVAGLLLLIPTSAFANADKEAPGVALTTGDVAIGAVADEAVAPIYIPGDIPTVRETGRELHEE
jgi:hypothetical protein